MELEEISVFHLTKLIMVVPNFYDGLKLRRLQEKFVTAIVAPDACKLGSRPVLLPFTDCLKWTNLYFVIKAVHAYQ